MLMLDTDDVPITPIIGWQTTVSEEDFAEFYTAEEKKEIRALAGWPVGRGFPASYIPAIRKYRPDIFEKAAKIIMTPEYLAYTLSGSFGISHSLAMPSTLCDQVNGKYNEKLLRKLGVSENMLPALYTKCTQIGRVKADLADKLGLSSGCKVVLGSFDHPAGAMGSGVYEVGAGLLSLGTSWVVLLPIKDRSDIACSSGLVDRFLGADAPYCIMKSVPSISDKINKLRERFFGKISHAEFDALVSKSAFGAGGLRFDFSDEDTSRAVGYSSADIARAIIESAAYKLKSSLDTLAASGMSADDFTVIGGITNSAVCIKVLSEVIGKPLAVVNGESAGAVGSAMMAAVGVGAFSDVKSAFAKMNFKSVTYQP